MAAHGEGAVGGGVGSGGGDGTIPFIGCRISLISKSEIRYEGTLYTIDAMESTVALSNVRSLGTEDRMTDKPVHPRPDVFDYIIFRAADIKDIRIVDAPKPVVQQPILPNDPAIVQHSVPSQPPPVSQPQPQQAPPTSYSAPIAIPPPQHAALHRHEPQVLHPHPTGAQLFSAAPGTGIPTTAATGLFGHPTHSASAFGPTATVAGPFHYSQPPPTSVATQMQQMFSPHSQSQSQPQQAPIGSGPVLPSPQAALGNVFGMHQPHVLKEQKQHEPVPSPPIGAAAPVKPLSFLSASSSGPISGPSGVAAPLIDLNVENPPSPGGKSSSSTAQQEHLQSLLDDVSVGDENMAPQERGAGPVGSRPGGGGPRYHDRRQQQQQELPPRYQQQQQRSYQNQYQQGGGGRGMYGNRGGNGFGQQGYLQRGMRRGGGGDGYYNMPQRGGGMAGGYQQRNYNRGGAGDYHRGYVPRGRGGIRRGPGQGQRLKFDSDYDFEMANDQFEKLKVEERHGDGSSDVEDHDSRASTPASGALSTTPSTGAGSATANGPCYDKTKSFFDSISCEITEREKNGTGRRTDGGRNDWRAQERKLNTETFGVGSPRGRGGGYRYGSGGGYRYGGGGGGQGYYNNYNRGGYYGGGGGAGGGRYQQRRGAYYRNAGGSAEGDGGTRSGAPAAIAAQT